MPKCRTPNALRSKPEYYKKILLKTIDHGELVWVHFCYVPIEIWDEFQEATGTTGCEMGAWLSKWAKDEFDLALHMAKREDIEVLKKAIQISYEDRYYELYSPTLGKARPPMYGIIKNWTSLRMKMEAAKYGSHKR